MRATTSFKTLNVYLAVIVAGACVTAVSPARAGLVPISRQTTIAANGHAGADNYSKADGTTAFGTFGVGTDGTTVSGSATSAGGTAVSSSARQLSTGDTSVLNQ